MANHERDRNRMQEDDWARQVPQRRRTGPYRDYGWERGQSALPEFRDPSIRVQSYERERVSRWRDLEDDRNVMEDWQTPGPFSGVGPRNYHRSDERILDEVCERLTRHGRIDASDIHVNVKDGEVTLEGQVKDRQTKRISERAIDNVHGVKDVHNRLKINRESGMPGGGAGRVDRVGQSGVYPASGPLPESNAEAQPMASWGQGERGAEGYQDHGESEIHPNRPKRE